MMRTGHILAFALTTLGIAATAAGQPAKDTLAYELVSATISATPPRVGFVIVEFGKSIPKRYLEAGNTTLPSGAEWTIETRERANPANTQTVAVTTVFVAADPALNRIVGLNPATPLNPATHQIRVRLREGNFPDVIVADPRKQGVSAFYAPAKGKDDADLYFKGLAVGTAGSKPAYSIDAKFAYQRALGARGGSLGGAATYVVDKASDIGPDTITVTTAYSKVFVWAAATGLILNVDPLGFELDAGNDTRNLRSGARGQFVVPSAQVGAKSYVTADLTAGYEAGRTQKGNAGNDGRGIWRTVFGASGYALLQGGSVVKRIDITASWTVRLLAQDEPLTRLVDGVSATTQTDEARHLVTVAGVLMVSKALGFSVGYRHGSEPPTYKHVKHRGEVGVVLKLKQVDKG
jgi:hypothetical protein